MRSEEKESGGQTLVIFAICLVVRLSACLPPNTRALLLPLPVILSLPAGVFGSFFLLYVVGLENNIYAQVALVMLIGLLGKNAILIIEVANQCRKEGVCMMGAAIQGATSRLRPISDDLLCFYQWLDPIDDRLGSRCLGEPFDRYGGGRRYVDRYVCRYLLDPGALRDLRVAGYLF